MSRLGGAIARAGSRGAPSWEALTRARAFPDDPSAERGVDWVQTHLSHVFLSADLVYKFRKPVDLGFVDFSDLAERNADCLREVHLNRRLAPDVYLGVAPLLGTGEALRVGRPAEGLAEGAAVEHCVVMRRLPEGRDALSLLRSGQLGGDRLDALAERIARFHRQQGLGAPAPFSSEEWRARCTGPVSANFRSLAGSEVVEQSAVERAQARAQAFVSGRAADFERRRRDGRAVDGHGDLHLQHLWYEEGRTEPIAIDCLEFDDALRRIDAASEVAFTAMDLRYRGAGELAERFLRSYAREADDFDLYSVVDYFLAYRAGVRAKVAALAAGDESVGAAQRQAASESARRHLELASRVLEPRPTPALVLVAGVVGTGKSSVAAALADRMEDAAVIASDRVRKRLAGVAPTERLAGGWGEGAYDAAHGERVYAGLLERARPVLASGRCAILDATFSRRRHRSAAAALARELGVAVFAVEVRCDPEVARERLARRAAEGRDPSDAGPEAHARSLRDFEPWEEWPEARLASLATDSQDWPQRLEALRDRIRLSRARPGTRSRRASP